MSAQHHHSGAAAVQHQNISSAAVYGSYTDCPSSGLAETAVANDLSASYAVLQPAPVGTSSHHNGAYAYNAGGGGGGGLSASAPSLYYGFGQQSSSSASHTNAQYEAR